MATSKIKKGDTVKVMVGDAVNAKAKKVKSFL